MLLCMSRARGGRAAFSVAGLAAAEEVGYGSAKGLRGRGTRPDLSLRAPRGSLEASGGATRSWAVACVPLAVARTEPDPLAISHHLASLVVVRSALALRAPQTLAKLGDVSPWCYSVQPCSALVTQP